MTTARKAWDEGNGQLGRFEPLIGSWQADADSPQGRIRCFRTFSRTLGGNYVLLEARWELPGMVYEEHALFGVDKSGELVFWSFTSDGQHSEGRLADASDLHPEALGFEAQMPAGLARMVYWPAEGEGFDWVAESKDPNGWNRFVHHRYTSLGE
jgi:hypothetical protein